MNTFDIESNKITSTPSDPTNEKENSRPDDLQSKVNQLELELHKLKIQLKEISVKENQANTDLKNLSNSNNNFLSAIAHELRTPLTSMLCWAQLLQRSGIDSAKITHGIKIIERSAFAQKRMIDELLELSRLQSGKIALDYKSLPWNEVFSLLLDQMEKNALDKNIRFERIVRLPKEIYTDPSRVQQMLEHLVENSIKYTSENGLILVTLDCIYDDNQESLRMGVIDTGKGISSDLFPKIINSLKANNKINLYDGSGLGLRITKGLVELFQGRIGVESSGEGKGTNFTITIPMKKTREVRP